MKKIIFMMFLSCLLVSQAFAESETKKLYYPNGKIMMETPYKKGVEDGVAKMYYENGKLMYETPYKSGKIEGATKVYSESGELAVELNYVDGVLKSGSCVTPSGKKKELTEKMLRNAEGELDIDCN